MWKQANGRPSEAQARKQLTTLRGKKQGNINRSFYDGCPVKWLVYSGASFTQICHHASRLVSLSSWCAAACRWPLWTQSKAQHCFRLFLNGLLSVLNPFGFCFGAGNKITRFLSYEMHTNIATDEIVNRQKWLNPKREEASLWQLRKLSNRCNDW